MSLYQNRIVVKVGTSTLTNDLGKSDLRSFDRLSCVLADIQNIKEFYAQVGDRVPDAMYDELAALEARLSK